MSFARRLEPEWLDLLPAEDPRARRSRRDLKRINALMFQTRIMTSLLFKHSGGKRPRRIIELGGGDGTFMLALARKLVTRWVGVTVTLVDQQDIVDERTRRAFSGFGWRLENVKADVFDYLARAEPADIVTANLFLHHFNGDPLRELLARAGRLSKLFAAAEPRRSAPSLIASRLLIAIGANDVTRHDAPASVCAGFRDRELSALWPSDGQWELHEKLSPPFTHVFAARRLG
ncbi:MAG TPA: methyltransferase domain-containing protein [Micropepsaceae bacterium]|nr:methyltransferase domain-containing protein [Micropepsaceae bacterium]